MLNTIQSLLDEAQLLEDFKDIPLSIINKIHITIFDIKNDFESSIVPVANQNSIHFELYINQNHVNILQNKNSQEYEISKSVLMHELYHLKEFCTTSSIIPLMDIYKIQKDCTRSLLLNFGYLQWTEYYAHYNSSKFYVPESCDINEICKLSKDVIEVIIKANDCYDEPFHVTEGLFDGIACFIKYVIKLSARYNQSKNKLQLSVLNDIKNDITYTKHYEYIIDIMSYMENLYTTYPSWVSEDNFLKIGIKLFDLIQLYGLTYSTDDLSDNFIFTNK